MTKRAASELLEIRWADFFGCCFSDQKKLILPFPKWFFDVLIAQEDCTPFWICFRCATAQRVAQENTLSKGSLVNFYDCCWLQLQLSTVHFC